MNRGEEKRHPMNDLQLKMLQHAVTVLFNSGKLLGKNAREKRLIGDFPDLEPDQLKSLSDGDYWLIRHLVTDACLSWLVVGQNDQD